MYANIGKEKSRVNEWLVKLENAPIAQLILSTKRDFMRFYLNLHRNLVGNHRTWMVFHGKCSWSTEWATQNENAENELHPTKLARKKRLKNKYINMPNWKARFAATCDLLFSLRFFLSSFLFLLVYRACKEPSKTMSKYTVVVATVLFSL